MVPTDDLSEGLGQIPILFSSFKYGQPIRVFSHLISPQSLMPTEKKELNNQTEPFPSAEEISTLQALPLEGDIQPTQGKDFILTTSSLTEEIKNVQS